MNNFKRILDKLNMKENEDYHSHKLEGVNFIQNAYYLSIESFKKILLSRCENNKICKYYLYLEKCIHYFNKY